MGKINEEILKTQGLGSWVQIPVEESDNFATERKGKERNATGKSPHLRCDLHAVVKAVGGAGVEACTRAEGGWAVAAEQQLESPQLASTAGS